MDISEYASQARLIFGILVSLFFSFYVYRDARRRNNLLFGTPPWLWALLVLAINIVGVLIYWLVHCSKLVNDQTS